MRRRRIALLVVLSVAMAGAGSVAAEGARKNPDAPWVELQRAVYQAGRVHVDFRVNNAIDPEALELIHSGIAVKFSHRIELLGRRRFWFTPRKQLARVVVETSVTYDALTGRYDLTRLTVLKEPHRAQAAPGRSAAGVTDDTGEMIRWMTSEREVELYDPLGDLPRDELRVSIESSIGRRYIMLFFPARQSVDVVGPVSD